MAVRLDINARVRGQTDVDRLRRGIRNVGVESNSVSRSLRSFSRALIALGTAVGFTRIAQEAVTASDAITNMTNQLRAAGVPVNQLPESLQNVRNLANQTRSTVSATGNLYARILRSTEALGVSQAEALQITQAFQQSLALSGASTEEAAAASLQFGQALASGRLQGDELRSILENNSFFAQQFARELGVGVGQLREMGAQGELTSETLARVALRLAPQMNEQFQMLTPTFGQATTVLRNGLNEALNDAALFVDQTLNIRARFEEAGMALASFFGEEGNQFGEVLDGAGERLYASLASIDYNAVFSDISNTFAQFVEDFYASLQDLNWEQAIAGLVTIVDNIDWFQLLVDAAEALLSAGRSFLEFFQNIQWRIVFGSVLRVFAAIPRDLVAGLSGIDWQEVFVGAFVQARDLTFSIAEGLQTALANVFTYVGNIFIGILNFGIEGVESVLNSIIDTLAGVEDTFVAIVNSVIAGLETGINDLLQSLPETVRDYLNVGRIDLGRIEGSGSPERLSLERLNLLGGEQEPPNVIDDVRAVFDGLIGGVNDLVEETEALLDESATSGEVFNQGIIMGTQAAAEHIQEMADQVGETLAMVGSTSDQDNILRRVFGFDDTQLADIAQDFQRGFQGAIENTLNEGAFDELGTSIFRAFTMSVNEQLAMNITEVFKGLWEGLINESEAGSGGILGIFQNIFSSIGMLFTGTGDNGGGVLGIVGSIFGGFFQDGGIVPGTANQPVPIVAHAGELVLNRNQQRRLLSGDLGTTEQTFNLNITGDVSRQTANVIQEMIPQIARGTNEFNRENFS